MTIQPRLSLQVAETPRVGGVPSGIGSAPYMDLLERHLACRDHDEVSKRIIALQPEVWPEARRALQV